MHNVNNENKRERERADVDHLWLFVGGDYHSSLRYKHGDWEWYVRVPWSRCWSRIINDVQVSKHRQNINKPISYETEWTENSRVINYVLIEHVKKSGNQAMEVTSAWLAQRLSSHRGGLGTRRVKWLKVSAGVVWRRKWLMDY